MSIGEPARVVETLPYASSCGWWPVLGFRDPQQHADDQHGDDGAEITDEVEATRTNDPVEGPGGVLTHPWFERGHRLWREDARQQAAVDIVQRWVLEEDDSRRELDPDLMSSRTLPLPDDTWPNRSGPPRRRSA